MRVPQITVDTNSVQILKTNPYRRSIIFHNPSSNVIFIAKGFSKGITQANASFRIPANSTRTLDWFHDGKKSVVGEWGAIADTGSNTFEYDEFDDEGFAGTNITTETAKKQGA